MFHYIGYQEIVGQVHPVMATAWMGGLLGNTVVAAIGKPDTHEVKWQRGQIVIFVIEDNLSIFAIRNQISDSIKQIISLDIFI